MSTGSDTQTTLAEDLSALVDGELHAGVVAGTCGRWRSDAASRATWHAYQLIGDVLRSEDLASDVARDAAFLSALRDRLAAEPVVLARQPAFMLTAVSRLAARAERRGRWSWAAPSAVAAGFVAVAGVLVVTRGPASLPAGQPEVRLAGASAQRGVIPLTVGSTSASASASAVQFAEPRSMAANGQLIRDAGLDRYLAAHKHFAGSAALGVPSAFLRSATVDASGR
jgi:sigma-E factor negative regulatory protein RseA